MTKFHLNAKHANRPKVEDNACAFIRELPKDRDWVIRIEKPEYSQKQRRSIFGPAYKALMEFSGLEGEDDKRELHRFMLCEYFGYTVNAFGIRKPKRTTTTDEAGQRNPIDVETAAKFYEFLQRKGADMGCDVPDPDPMKRK